MLALAGELDDFFVHQTLFVVGQRGDLVIDHVELILCKGKAEIFEAVLERVTP